MSVEFLSFPPPTFALSEAVESMLLRVLLQLIVVMIAARVFAALFRRMGQPAVVGEIFAGVILGPSLLSGLSRRLAEGTGGVDVMAWIFTSETGPVFNMLAQLGLVLLLFLIGLEFDFSHLRAKGPAAFWISAVGVALPFGLGVALAPLMHPHMGANQFGKEPSFREFSLFMGTAMSITALPILGRMMMELKITRTRIGALTISAAAVDDAVGWILLATVAALTRSALAGGEFNILDTARMAGLTVAFAAVMFLVVRPLMIRVMRLMMSRNDGELGLNGLTVLLVAIFVCAIATNLIGIFAIFGAFALGAALSTEHELREAVNRALKNLVTAFFLPIFFTFTGLRTDIGTLDSPLLWGLCALVSAAAIFGKFGGCGVVARISGFPAREAACIGVMMNTRALMELVVINTGYDLGVLTKSSFCMLVLMALLTTWMATPILLRLVPGTELEPWIRTSGFLPATPTEPDKPTIAGPSPGPAGA